MRLRHAFVLAALAFLLSACGSGTITGPETKAGDAAAASGSIGWGGAGGRSAEPTGGDS